MSSRLPVESVLRVLQRQVEAVYGVNVHLDVDAYTVSADVCAKIPGAIEGLVEQFFVHDAGEFLELALFIAPQIITQLQSDVPHLYLRFDSLESFCVALEGVSHFVFLSWRAIVQWPVSALEMELQAEVDKFVCAWLLILQGQAVPQLTVHVLLEQLFARYLLRDGIPQNEHERYETAHHVARRFCRNLVLQHGKRPQAQQIISTARAFFRGGLPEKMQMAAAQCDKLRRSAAQC